MFVERFMAWSASAGIDQRVDAISQLAHSYLNEEIAADDKRATEQVFTLYLKDPSVKVRTTMSEALCEGVFLPRALMWSILQDCSEVSAPFYAHSPLLKAPDLIHALEHGDDKVQCAVASRATPEAAVVRNLVEKGSEAAVMTLLENPSVHIGPGLLHDVASRLGAIAEIRNALLQREDIMSATRQLLAHRLSGALVSMLGDKGWANNEALALTARDATNRVAIDIAADAPNEEMHGYVTHLIETGQLTPALLVRAICGGHALFFEYAISMLSGKSLARVQAIVDEARISSFKALYGRTGLPQGAYAVFTAAISAWQSEAENDVILDDIIVRASNDENVDGAWLALLGRMAAEDHQAANQTYERQLLLAA